MSLLTRSPRAVPVVPYEWAHLLLHHGMACGRALPDIPLLVMTCATTGTLLPTGQIFSCTPPPFKEGMN